MWGPQEDQRHHPILLDQTSGGVPPPNEWHSFDLDARNTQRIFMWLPPAAADPTLDLYMVNSHDLLNHFGFILSPLCVRGQRARRIETERTR